MLFVTVRYPSPTSIRLFLATLPSLLYLSTIRHSTILSRLSFNSYCTIAVPAPCHTSYPPLLCNLFRRGNGLFHTLSDLRPTRHRKCIFFDRRYSSSIDPSSNCLSVLYTNQRVLFLQQHQACSFSVCGHWAYKLEEQEKDKYSTQDRHKGLSHGCIEGYKQPYKAPCAHHDLTRCFYLGCYLLQPLRHSYRLPGTMRLRSTGI